LALNGPADFHNQVRLAWQTGNHLNLLSNPLLTQSGHRPLPAYHSRSGRYGISAQALALLLRLDVGGADHLAPLLGFIGDQLAEIGWRECEHDSVHVGKPRFDLGVG
jgi:hypothetical protein